MNEDEKIIKKKYGEKMMHYCKKNFSTILENKGSLANILLTNFAPSHFLYTDIIKYGQQLTFNNFIYSLANLGTICYDTKKSVKELLSSVGYTLYECNTKEEVNSFSKYYAKGEELCTFKEDRLKICYVFFAIKDNALDLKREDFSTPLRQDEYGVSVISIQFTRDNNHILSIKNRYNHHVDNPDATYSNNLDNIVLGLTKAFENEYGLIQKNSKYFDMGDYVKANDGLYYKYNYEFSGTYYCPDNIIIKNGKVKQYSKEKFVLMDYFLLDLVNKKFIPICECNMDSFIESMPKIKKIVIENKDNKLIYINDDIIIKLNDKNNIISYINPYIVKLEDCFLYKSSSIMELMLPNVESIGNYVMNHNNSLRKLYIPKVKSIGNSFMSNNVMIEELFLPKVKRIGNDFLSSNIYMKTLYAPNLQITGDFFMFANTDLVNINFSDLLVKGKYFMPSNENHKALIRKKYE